MWCDIDCDVWREIYPMKRDAKLLTHRGEHVEYIDFVPHVTLRRDSVNHVNSKKCERPRYIYLDPGNFNEPRVDLYDAQMNLVASNMNWAPYLKEKPYLRIEADVIDPSKYRRRDNHKFHLKLTDAVGSLDIPFVVKWWKQDE